MAASLSIGIAVWDRPSELLRASRLRGRRNSLRRRLRVTRKTASAALALFILPFLFSVGCYLVRNDPGRLAIRDDAERDEILKDVSKEITRGYGAHPSAIGKVGKAVTYCLGLNWTTNPRFRLGVAGRTLIDYASTLTGVSVLGRQPSRVESAPARRKNVAASIGLAGLVLSVSAARLWRKRRAWIAFGGALFVGNLLFVLWHHSWDNMTFTIPGVAGLAFLAGLGSADWKRIRRGWAPADLRTAIAAAAVLFLLIGNFGAVGRRGEPEREAVAFGREVGAAPWPGRA